MTTFLAPRLLSLALGLALAAATALAAAAPADTPQSGRQYLAEGDHASAVRDYADAVRLNPGDATALNNLAVSKAAAGDYQGALALLQRARKAEPTRADIGYNLATLRSWARHYSALPPGQGRRSATSPASPSLWATPPLASANLASPTCAGVACK